MENSNDYWNELRKQFQNMPKYTLSPEFTKVVNNSSAILKQSLKIFVQSDAMKAALQMAEQIKNFN